MGLNSECNREGGGVSGARKGPRGGTRVRGLRLNPPTRILAEPGQVSRQIHQSGLLGRARGPGQVGSESGDVTGSALPDGCGLRPPCPAREDPRVQRSQPPNWTPRGAGRRLRSSRLSPPRRPAAGSAGEGQGGRLPGRQPTTGPGSPSGGGRPPLGAGPWSFPTGYARLLALGFSFPELGFDQNVYEVKVSMLQGAVPVSARPLPAECGVSASLGKGWHLVSGGWAGPAPGLTSGDIFAQMARKTRCSPSFPASPLQPLLRSPPQPRKHSDWQ